MSRLTRDERKLQTREQLVRAGCDLVRQRGFAVSVDDIAAAAGFTKGAVYSNFGSRHDLMLAIAERVLPTAGSPLDASAATLADALEAAGRELAARVDHDRDDFILNLDLVVTVLRQPAFRHAVLARQQELLEQEPVPVPPFPLPLDNPQFQLVVDAVAAGLVLQRMLHGTERVPDELFVWTLRQLAGSQPASDR